jgi:hypothetical protein
MKTLGTEGARGLVRHFRLEPLQRFLGAHQLPCGLIDVGEPGRGVELPASSLGNRTTAIRPGPARGVACPARPSVGVRQVAISALLIWSARELAHDLLALGIHRVQALLHHP